jgi:hypothetical protein
MDDPSMWNPILTTPFDLELELAVLNEDGEHALVLAASRARSIRPIAAKRQPIPRTPLIASLSRLIPTSVCALLQAA